MQGARKLKKDVEAKIEKWDERSSFTLKGVKNLSFADMECLLLYAEDMIRFGNLSQLMKPLGKTRQVLEKYKMLS